MNSAEKNTQQNKNSVITQDLDLLQSIRKFKEDLIAQIPFTPNNRESKSFLLNLDIGSILHIYDFWRHRFITPRPRKTFIPNQIRNNDPLYLKNKENVKAVLKKIEIGEDISSHLSRKVHEQSFDVEDFKNNRNFIGSRDHLLVCEGFYHLHLEPYPKRTDELIIGHAAEDGFEVIGIFSHKIFETENSESEKNKFNAAINNYLRRKMPNGGYCIGGAGGGMQNLAGSSIANTWNQINNLKILQNVEFVKGGIEQHTRNLYKTVHNRTPKNVKAIWRMNHRNVEIFDRVNKVVFDGIHLMPTIEDHRRAIIAQRSQTQE